MLALLLLACPAPSETAFEPDVLFVEGVFGYDADLDAAVAYSVDGDAVPPTLVFGLATASWFETGLASERCDIVVQHDGDPLPREAWASALAVGFDLPADAAVEDGCEGVWDDEALLAGAWGLGVGALDEGVAEELEAAVLAQGGAWQEDWEPVVFGGGFYWEDAADTFADGYVPHDYAFAAAVDDDLAMILDDEGDSASLPADDVLDGEPPDGAYIVRAWLGIDADLLAP